MKGNETLYGELRRRYRPHAREAVRLVGGFLVVTGIAFLAVDGIRFALSLFGGAP